MTERPYVFEGTRHEAELERLRLLETVFDPATRACLLATGLRAGWRCLEVGAGAGSVATWLSAAAGPSGSVLAVDVNTRFLSGLAGANLEVREADIREAEIEPGSFDLAHARFVLIHIPDWQGALAAMIRCLKPGGWLVLEEPDFSGSRSFAGSADLRSAFDNVHQAIEAMVLQRGLDHAFGARLPALLLDGGLEGIAIENDAPIVPGGSPLARMMALSTQQLSDKYVATGLATLRDIELYGAFAADRACWATYHATVRASGRKPGVAGFQRRRPGPPPDQTRRQRLTNLLADLLSQDRTWTSAQLTDALRPHGIDLGTRQVRRYLKLLKAGYRRTASTLRHKQDAPKVEHAKAVLGSLKNKAAAGRLILFYLDESGFSPSLPLGYSWCLPGQRKRVPYEYPQGRRVNVLAAYEPYGPDPWLGTQAFERTLTSDALLAYLQSLPAALVPRVVVLDNASIHVSKAFQAQRKDLSRRGIYLYYLPAYSPELNEIEPVFKQVKHHEIPQRSHTSKQELRNWVEQGFDSYAKKLPPKRDKQLRPAA